ncbi:hypothetical protein L2449_21025 [Mesorhizobium muleiense]|uniref:hypothetical protein n=1 Tax=Mesorhizobium muleiense TaxID=1004279 RepID=UPI001F42C3F5|nr:hypothetical protein [Mesorhizobium muleiense]MCF6119330.1 hypothetical protein [Mesorhizobium muleiense]
MEGLDLPAHGVPVELLDGVVVGMHGQIADQLPVDPWPMLWFLTLLGVQHGEVERGIALLLADRRQALDAAVFDLDRDGLRLALGIANLDLMQPADLFLVISVAIVCSPSPAKRSTQVLTRKWVPSSWAVQKSS